MPPNITVTPKPYGHVAIPFQRIHIELTNICDFNCLFCPKSLMTRKYGFMDEELAGGLLREISSKGLAEKVTFHVMGEPTLHPKFFEVLAFAEAVGMPVGLTTNGGGLGGPVGERLLDFNLKQVDVSLQTPDPVSFRLRKARGLCFEEYIEGAVRFFARYRKRWPETVFKFRFLNTSFPPKAIEERQGPMRVISSAAELQETFGVWIGRIYDLLGINGKARDAALLRLRSLKAWQWNVVEVLPGTFFETYVLADWGNAFSGARVRDAWAGYCTGMRDHFAVLHNGAIVLCCVDFDGKTRIGDARNQTLEEALHSRPLGRVMKEFRRFQPVMPHCRKCLGARSRASWLVKPFVQLGLLSVFKPWFYKRTILHDAPQGPGPP